MSRASVVIASNRPWLIADAIAPVLADPATLEVVVVAVDAPEVVAAAQAIDDPRVRIATAPAGNPNIARQIGVQRARGEIVVMLDDDVLPSPGLVSGHIAHHGQPGRIVVGYMPIPSERLRGARRFPARLYSNTYEGRVAWWTEASDHLVTGLWGGNVSMARADVLRVGLENPSFRGRYFEDHDFGQRCHAAGIVGVFDRSLRADHLYERSISEWLVEGRRQGAAHAVGDPDCRPGAQHLPAALRPALVAATVLAAALHIRRLELRLAWTARQIELARGAREVANGTAVASGLIAPATPSGRLAMAPADDSELSPMGC